MSEETNNTESEFKAEDYCLRLQLVYLRRGRSCRNEQAHL